jgi:NADP-dependent aldehyde dehydrogenase
VPLGPVAVFGASNFPLAFSVAGGDTASAWAAGCPVVVKAHPSHPGTSEIVAGAVVRAIEQEDMPPGVFSMVHGGPAAVAVPLVQHPRIRAVGFTGSRTAGLALVRAAAERPVPIPVYAEMSSVNPVILLPGALAERAAELGRSYVASLVTGQGQLCTSPGLIFAVDSDDLDTFVRFAAQAVSDTGEGAMLSSSICAAYGQGVARLRSTAGVTEVATGTGGGSIAAGAVATVFDTGLQTFQGDPTLAEEVFGAVSLIVRTGSTDDLMDAVERLEGQLTATIHHGAGDEDATVRLRERLELIAGRVLFDGWPTGVEVGHAMVHGGPFPATSDGRTTSVGTLAIERFVRPVVYQAAPQEALPPVLRDGNPLGVWRQVDGVLGRH